MEARSADGYFLCAPGCTSKDGELRVNCDFPHRVLGHTLVHVLIPGRPKWLDPQHCPRALVKVNGLGRGIGSRWDR